jgi:tRNA (guanine6-N2)-methyltransferase
MAPVNFAPREMADVANTVELLLTTVPGVEDIAEQELRSIAKDHDLDLVDTELNPMGAQGQLSCQFDSSDEDALLTSIRKMRSIHHVHRIRHQFPIPAIDPLSAIREEAKSCPLPEMESAKSFRVTGHRKGLHDFTSVDIARAVGGVLHNRFGVRVDLEHFDLDVNVHAYEQTCALIIPQTQDALNRHPNRVYLPRIGIQPALAYCMLSLSGLEDGSDRRLLDPFCGGGTILLEAAERYSAVEMHGGDAAPKAAEGTVKNVTAVGLTERIHVEHGRAQNIDQRFPDTRFDAIVTNPPFGVGVGPGLNFYFLYKDFLVAADAILKQSGRIVMLVLERGTFKQVLSDIGIYQISHERHVSTGAIRPTLFVLEKANA